MSNTADSSIGKNVSTDECLELPSVCDLAMAAKVHAMITDRLADTDIRIDAGAVERCGTPVAQILVATSQQLDEQGNRLVINSMSEQFKQSFVDLGLEDYLRKWE